LGNERNDNFMTHLSNKLRIHNSGCNNSYSSSECKQLVLSKQ